MSALPGSSPSRAAFLPDPSRQGTMVDESIERQVHRFCWVDLATVDERVAKLFYTRLFGWTVHDRRVGKGQFGTFAHRDAPFASLYQLTRKQIVDGVPSHWT